jgi:hypothetical protein
VASASSGARRGGIRCPVRAPTGSVFGRSGAAPNTGCRGRGAPMIVQCFYFAEGPTPLNLCR